MAHPQRKITLRYHLPALVLIFLIAAAGRILNIDAESLWVDEGFSYWALQHDDMLGVILRDVHPPLYFFGLEGWSSLTGISELALRYFSVIPSLLSVAMIYHLARELQYLRTHSNGRAAARPYNADIVPVLAALMMALADMENYIAQEARMYTWHVLLIIISGWAFLRWLRTSAQWAAAVWIGATLAALFTQYVSVAATAVQGLYVLLFLRGQKQRAAFLRLIVIGVIFGVWLLLVVPGQTGNVGTGFNVPSTLESLWNYRINWLTEQWALLGGLAILGASSLRRWRFNASFLMVMWVVVPVTGAYVLNHFTPILIDYRLTQITPAVALLIAFGLGAIPAPSRPFLVAVIVVYGVTIDDTPRPRPPWREVGRNAAQFAQPGDLALADIEPSGDWQVMYYYDRFMPEGVERRSLRQWRIEERDSYPTGLPALIDAYDTVWFMHWSGNQDAFNALENSGHVRTATMTEDWLGNDLNVYRYDRLPDDDTATYENGMILMNAEVIDSELRVDLWWQVDESISNDYTVSVILLDENGVLVAQDDAYPFMGQRPTSTFQPGEIVYDPHTLKLRDDLDSLSSGMYTVGVKVYLWRSEGITVQPTSAGEEFATVGTLTR